jgi:crossover junction endodeoxyribonuclease RuvC
MILAGIDPGLLGALAVIDGGGSVLLLADLPVHSIGKANGKLRTELDIHGLAALIKEAQASRVIIEQVTAMPKQGVTSTFRLGYACGASYGLVLALDLPVLCCTPRRWQQHYRIAEQERLIGALGVP